MILPGLMTSIFSGLFQPVVAQTTAQITPTGMEFTEHAWVIGLMYLAIVVIGVVLDVGLVFAWMYRPPLMRNRIQALKRRSWSRLEGTKLVVFLTGLYLVVNIAVGLTQEPDENPGTIWIVIQSVFFHLAGLGFIMASMKRQGLTWGNTFGFNKSRIGRDIRLGVILYLATLPLFWFYSMIYQLGLQYVGYDTIPQEVVMVFSSETSWVARLYMILLAAIMAPLFEELLFRGIAFPLVARRWGLAPAVIVVSAVFAIVHFHVPSLVPLFLLAVALSLGYMYSGSLLVPMVMHGLFNTVNLVLLLMLSPQ